MREVICDTSSLLYLHQIKRLELLRRLCDHVVVPSAVVSELREGLALGVDVPDPNNLDWMEVETPHGTAAMDLVTDLGLGETEVLTLAMEREGAVALVDDRLARRLARQLNIPLTGTLGVLLDAKRAGFIDRLTPLMDELQSLGFRLAPQTRRAVLELAGESS